VARAGLTPDRVVAEGAAVADDVGLDRLTMAAVAGRLEVRLPSLYKHVDGLDALRRGVSRQALDELAERLSAASVGRSRGEALHAMGTAYRSYAQQHPGRYAATVRAPDPSDAAWSDAGGRVLAVVLSVLDGYGLQGVDAIDATRAVRAALHGYVSLEAAGGFAMDRDTTASFERLVAGLDAALAAAAGTPA
jgi:AcrR family transcriptional regulator